MDRQRAGAAAVVGLIGTATLAVPVFDVYQDVSAPGKPAFSTLIENAPLLVLSLVILGVAGWLAATDWKPTYAWTVARTAALNAVGVATLVVLVVSVQRELQDELLPVIIAADAVVIGAVGGVALGLRTAQQERAADEAVAQRDRFRALFENVPTPTVGVAVVDSDPIVRAVNPAFAETFGVDRDEIVGESLTDRIVPPDVSAEPVGRPSSTDGGTEGADRWDSDVIELETDDGRRQFLRATAPVRDAPAHDGYAIFIDVTAERQRRERLRVLSRMLRHDIRNKLTIVEGGLHDVVDAVDGPVADRAEMAARAARELERTSEQTRRVERQIAGESDPGPRDVTVDITQAAAAVRADHPEATVVTDLPASAVGSVTTAFGTAVEEVIRNGVEHNDRQAPRVEVTVAESLAGEYLDVRVADDGPGLDPEQAEIVEETGETDRKTRHLDGLGLWTVRWVLQNSGGDVEFEANDPRGTVVTLRVPRVDAAD